MACISKQIPETGSFETKEDRDLCLHTIETHIARGNREALGFLQLVERGIFEYLYIRASLPLIFSEMVLILLCRVGAQLLADREKREAIGSRGPDNPRSL